MPPPSYQPPPPPGYQQPPPGFPQPPNIDQTQQYYPQAPVYQNANQQVQQQAPYVQSTQTNQTQNEQPQTSSYQYIPPKTDSNGNYIYDSVVTYQQISIDQWSQIPNDDTKYSYLWLSPDSFTPQKFSENQTKNTTCINKGWAIAFIVNFAIFIILTILMSVIDINTLDNEPKTLSEETSGGKIDNPMGLLIGVSLGICFIINVFHGIYMFCSASIYIKFGLFIIALIVLIAFCVPLAFDITIGVFTAPIGAVLFLLLICVYFCCLKKYIEFSVKVFKKTTDVIKKHPGVYLYIFIDALISVVINAIFSVSLFALVWNNWSYYIYIYIIFTYYWTTQTMNYVLYLIFANLAAIEYFLDQTEYMPKHPLLDSIKRSYTKTFGPASFAGFICAVINVLRTLSQEGMRQDNACIVCISCVVHCCLVCIECIFAHISKYGLFYVTVYGIPFVDGCKRFFEVSYKRFLDVLLARSIVNEAMQANMVAFGIVGGAIGAAVAYFVWDAVVPVIAFCGVFTLMFTLIVYCIMTMPLDSFSYSIFICFAEYPERLKTTDYSLYDGCVNAYTEGLGESIEVQEKRRHKNNVDE